MDCSESRWNRMGWIYTTSAAFLILYCQGERRVWNFTSSLFPTYNAKSEWSKMKSTHFTQRWRGRSTAQNICSSTVCPQEVHSPSSQFKNSFPVFFRIHQKTVATSSMKLGSWLRAMNCPLVSSVRWWEDLFKPEQLGGQARQDQKKGVK